MVMTQYFSPAAAKAGVGEGVFIFLCLFPLYFFVLTVRFRDGTSLEDSSVLRNVKYYTHAQKKKSLSSVGYLFIRADSFRLGPESQVKCSPKADGSRLTYLFAVGARYT